MLQTLIKFSNKENFFVADPAGYLVFMSTLFYFLNFNYWIQHYKSFLFQKGTHIQSRIANPVKHLRWSVLWK